MVTAKPVPAADGSTKIFDKMTSADQIGSASDGTQFRAIMNMDAAQSIFIGETQALANAASAWEIKPGQFFTLLGPAGIGWGGDLYAKGNASAVLQTMKF
jgi:hypothetical protein